VTFEHKILAGFEEIQAVVFECNTCKTRVSIPVKEFTSGSISCPKKHGWTTGNLAIDRLNGVDAFAMLVAHFGNSAFQEQSGFRILLDFDSKQTCEDK
jgi:hypothetical protein